MRQVALPSLDARETLVESVMTPVQHLAYATEDNDVSSCLQAMAALGCHHLPVLSREGDDLLGVLYIGELVGLTRKHLEEAVSAWELGQGVGRAIGEAVERLRAPSRANAAGDSAPGSDRDAPDAPAATMQADPKQQINEQTDGGRD